MVALLALAMIFLFTRRSSTATQVGTVAVIPYSSTADTAAMQLAEAIAEDLTTLLQGDRALRVINRASAFALRGVTVDLEAAAERLGVDHVIQLSGRRSDDGVRLTVELVDVQTGVVGWARQFTTTRDGAASLPQQIASTLLGSVFEGTSTPAPVAHAPTPAAYDAFLRGRFFRHRLSQPTDVDSALFYLFKAVSLDTAFAAPYAVLAGLYVDISGTSIRVPEAYAMADSMARRAVALDPRNAEALAVRGWSALVRRWAWDEAARDLDAAAEADPNSSTVRFYRAVYRASTGENRLALEEARTGAWRDPLYPVNWHFRVFLEATAGNIDSAFAAQRHLDAIAPGFAIIGSNIAEVYRMTGRADSALHRDTLTDRYLNRPTSGTALSLVALGRLAEARAHVQRMRTAYTAQPMLPESIARAAAAIGDRAEAITWLERAADEHSDLPFMLLQSPELRPLAREPRVQALLARTRAPATLRAALGLAP